jgi:hypothetical protein
VRYRIAKMSLRRRAALMQEVADLFAELEFQEAGTDCQSQLRARQLQLRLEAAYIRWGLLEVAGLVIDGEAADADRLLEHGPERLAHEVAQSIRTESGLSEAEVKN